jgi:hypothetical protein
MYNKCKDLSFNALTQEKSHSKNRLFTKMAGPTGIEPATYGLRVRRSSLTEPRARIKLLLKKVPYEI